MACRAKLLEIQSGGYGVGLRGIRERINQFHGEMRIESENPGTKILVILPLAASAEDYPLPSLEAKVI